MQVFMYNKVIRKGICELNVSPAQSNVLVLTEPEAGAGGAAAHTEEARSWWEVRGLLLHIPQTSV